MSTTDWSETQIYDKDAAYKVYLGYRDGIRTSADFVDAFLGMAHHIVAVKFRNMYSFDREDLIAVAIERLVNAVEKQQGVFHPKSKDTAYSNMHNYAYTVMYNAMRTFLTKFDLSVTDLEPVFHSTIWDERAVCSPEYLFDLKELYTFMSKKVIIHIKGHNRFDIDNKLIKYFAYQSIEGKKVSQALIKSLFGCKKPADDLDNLKFLYKWALYEICTEYDYMSLDKCIEILSDRKDNATPVQPKTE